MDFVYNELEFSVVGGVEIRTREELIDMSFDTLLLNILSTSDCAKARRSSSRAMQMTVSTADCKPFFAASVRSTPSASPGLGPPRRWSWAPRLCALSDSAKLAAWCRMIAN